MIPSKTGRQSDRRFIWFAKDNVAKVARRSTYAAVPLTIAFISAMQLSFRGRSTEFLVLPPIAVLVYLIFRDPFGPSSNLRSVVLLPCVGAITGVLCSRYLGLTPLGVGVTCLAVLFAQDMIRASMPPAIALGVLALLLHADDARYVVNVFQDSLGIAMIFFLWRSFAFGARRVP